MYVSMYIANQPTHAYLHTFINANKQVNIKLGNGTTAQYTGGGGLVASMVGIPAQSPEFESPDRLTTFLLNNR